MKYEILAHVFFEVEAERLIDATQFADNIMSTVWYNLKEMEDREFQFLGVEIMDVSRKEQQ